MSSVVSVTSQGQISIPIKLRRKLGLDKVKKAFITEHNGKIIVEPVRELTDLAGSLQKYTLKDKTHSETTNLEKKAVEQAIIERYERKRKNEGQSLLILKP